MEVLLSAQGMKPPDRGKWLATEYTWAYYWKEAYWTLFESNVLGETLINPPTIAEVVLWKRTETKVKEKNHTHRAPAHWLISLRNPQQNQIKLCPVLCTRSSCIPP